MSRTARSNTRLAVWKNVSPYVEVGLQGPGLMMAQGNYWGDINPLDGKGDALGECGCSTGPARRATRHQ